MQDAGLKRSDLVPRRGAATRPGLPPATEGAAAALESRDVLGLHATLCDDGTPQDLVEVILRQIWRILVEEPKMQDRIMGVSDEGGQINDSMVRGLVTAIDKHCHPGSPSSADWSPSVAYTGAGVLCKLLSVQDIDRRMQNRDALVNAGCIPVLLTILLEHGCKTKVETFALSTRTAETSLRCLHIICVNSDGNTAYLLSQNTLHVVSRVTEAHNKHPGIARWAQRLKDILYKLKNDPAFELEAEAQRLAIIAAQPDATTADRVNAAKAQARVQMIRMSRAT